MSNNNDLTKNISEWIQTQGYSLEVKVANAFQRSGFSTVVSTWYTDYETNDLREIDIIAEKISEIKKNSRAIRIDWHISCKTSNDKPWVVFLAENQQVAPLFSYACIGSLSLQEHLRNKTDISKWNEIFKDEPLLVPKKRGHGVVQAFSSVDLPYQAMMSAIKSCVYSAQSPEIIVDSKTKKRFADLWSISIPVVVINTKLFECVIDQQDRELVSEVKESCIVGRKIQYDKYFAWPLVHIVTASEINNFTQRAMNASEKIINALLKQ